MARRLVAMGPRREVGFFGTTLASQVTPHLAAHLQTHDLESGATTPRHGHVCPYLALVVSGGLRELTDREEHLCTPGSLALDTCGAEHEDRFHARHTELINIELAPSWLESLNAERSIPPTFRWLHRRGLPGRARLLRRHVEHPEPLSAFVVEGVAAELLLLALGSAGHRRKGPAPAWLARVEEAVRAGFRKPPPLGELAALAGRSPSHVARAFRNWRGASLGSFVRRVRAEHARRALLESSLALSEIARDSGYSDQSHMTRELATFLGCTPGRLRREHRRDP